MQLSRPVRILLFIITFVVGVPILLLSIFVPEFPIQSPDRRAIGRIVANQQFNFATWEIETIYHKLEGALIGGRVLIPADEQLRLVDDYLEEVGRVRRLERQFERLYAEESADVEAEATQIQLELREARSASQRLQLLGESILQQQVSGVLYEESFSVAGTTWPPVSARMTPLPLMLIISPRDDIRQLYAFPLKPGMEIPVRDAIENQVFEQLELSALVTRIGGLGIFPAMVVETDRIVFLTDTLAHEWTHHWLTMRPLGLNYAQTPQLRTMNETVASIVGEEVGLRVLQAYYPDDVPPPASAEAPLAPDDPDPFDFRAEMRITRLRVDELIAAGEIEAAELYMEQRRLVFVENGYLIRKLNQAYFAFYGAYADDGGATGDDPVGPTVVAVREKSDSLRSFLRDVGQVTTFAQLEALLNTLESQ